MCNVIGHSTFTTETVPRHPLSHTGRRTTEVGHDARPIQNSSCSFNSEQDIEVATFCGCWCSSSTTGLHPASPGETDNCPLNSDWTFKSHRHVLSSTTTFRRHAYTRLAWLSLPSSMPRYYIRVLVTATADRLVALCSRQLTDWASGCDIHMFGNVDTDIAGPDVKLSARWLSW